MAILAAVLAVIAGTVGRAQDARRWNRLQRGSASQSDTSRMWVATPWYLLRSLLSTGFAFILGLMVAALTLWISNVTGIMRTVLHLLARSLFSPASSYSSCWKSPSTFLSCGWFRGARPPDEAAHISSICSPTAITAEGASQRSCSPLASSRSC